MVGKGGPQGPLFFMRSDGLCRSGGRGGKPPAIERQSYGRGCMGVQVMRWQGALTKVAAIMDGLRRHECV